MGADRLAELCRMVAFAPDGGYAWYAQRAVGAGWAADYRFCVFGREYLPFRFTFLRRALTI